MARRARSSASGSGCSRCGGEVVTRARGRAQARKLIGRASRRVVYVRERARGGWLPAARGQGRGPAHDAVHRLRGAARRAAADGARRAPTRARTSPGSSSRCCPRRRWAGRSASAAGPGARGWARTPSIPTLCERCAPVVARAPPMTARRSRSRPWSSSSTRSPRPSRSSICRPGVPGARHRRLLLADPRHESRAWPSACCGDVPRRWRWIVALLSLVALVVLAVRGAARAADGRAGSARLALGLIFGGAVGNLDRSRALRRGGGLRRLPLARLPLARVQRGRLGHQRRRHPARPPHAARAPPPPRRRCGRLPRAAGSAMSERAAPARVAHGDAAEAGARLDRWLAARLPELSRTRVQALIDGGHVRGRRAGARRPRTGSRAGEAVEARDSAAAARGAGAGGRSRSRIVFEDEHVLVVDKPAGMVMHPGAGHADGHAGRRRARARAGDRGRGRPAPPRASCTGSTRARPASSCWPRPRRAYDALTAQLARRTVTPALPLPGPRPVRRDAGA